MRSFEAMMSTAIVAALAGALAGPVDAAELGRVDSNRPYWSHPPALRLRSIPTTPVLPRPEIRSYQPYSGLQYDFRPEPPGERGIRPEDEETRPQVVMPEAVPPLMEYGHPPPHSGGHYSYCSELAPCR